MARHVDAVPRRAATVAPRSSRSWPSCSWPRPSANMSSDLPLGASGWLRGLTDPAVTKALSIIHSALCRGSGRRGARARGRRFAHGARREVRRADRRAADALLRALADAHGGEHASRRQAERGERGLFRRLQFGGRIQSRVQARIWRAAGDVAPAVRGEARRPREEAQRPACRSRLSAMRPRRTGRGLPIR